MKRTIAVVAALLAATGAVIAQSDPIAQRQALMKENGKATGAAVKMLKGEAPFDLAVAQEALKAYVNTAAKAPALFPDTSKTGGETEALPAVWTAKADFEAKFAKLGKDAEAAMAAIKDEASFKAAFPGVLKNCGDCHETYRAKKS